MDIVTNARLAGDVSRGICGLRQAHMHLHTTPYRKVTLTDLSVKGLSLLVAPLHPQEFCKVRKSSGKVGVTLSKPSPGQLHRLPEEALCLLAVPLHCARPCSAPWDVAQSP